MNKIYKDIFLYGINISYVLYFMVFIGISSMAPKYLSILKNFLQIYIALLLIYLYNPLTYKKRNFTDFDRKLVFSAGTFLLLSTTLIGTVEEYLKLNNFLINFSAFE